MDTALNILYHMFVFGVAIVGVFAAIVIPDFLCYMKYGISPLHEMSKNNLEVE